MAIVARWQEIKFKTLLKSACFEFENLQSVYI